MNDPATERTAQYPSAPSPNPSEGGGEGNRLGSRVAVVTGASSGIGRATALELARQGWDLVVHAAHSQRSAQEVAAAVRSIGRRAEVRLADFSHTEGLSEFVNQAFQAFGQVDAWINNAGADVLTGPAASDDWLNKAQTLWRTDLLATLVLSRESGVRMRQQPAAAPGVFSIVNMGWDQAWQGMAGDSGELFAAIKGGVMAATLSLAQMFAPEIRVNCVAPGWIQTAWGQSASARWQDRARRESLMDRWGHPDDVARTIAFLCSPAARFIAGQVVNVNGGFRYEQSDPLP